MRKVYILAWAVCQENMRQGLYYLILALFTVLIVASPAYTFFVFREEIKMIRDMGLASITLAGLLIVLFSATAGINEEVEQKTSMMILSKPVHRYQFVLGKFFGIVFTAFIPMAWLLALLMFTLTVAPIRDGGWENLKEFELLKGGLLALTEVSILASLAVMLSTILPMALGFALTATCFVLGHLSGYAYARISELGGFAGIVAKILYALIPDLEYFNVAPAVGLGHDIPGIYVGTVLLYGLMFIIAMLFTACILVETREIA